MSYTVLIADDSAIVRKVLMKTLKLTRLDIGEIYQAENGRQALELLHRQQVDLVFLDINMPVMNGMEFMEELEKYEKLRRVPVIVVSTEGSRERKETLLQHDIKAYLRKPVTPEQLSETVCRILGGR